MTSQDFEQQRLKDLEDTITSEQKLLKQYQDSLRYTTDPRDIARINREIERQKNAIAQYQQEYAQLQQQLTDSTSTSKQKLKKEKQEELKPKIQDYEKERGQIQTEQVESLNRVVLILAANPINKSKLSLEPEFNSIKDILEKVKNGKSFDIQTRLTSELFDLREALFQIKPQIVHFCGCSTEKGCLLFKHHSGEYKPISSRALSNLFRKFTDIIECVVLNICYSEEQAEAISEYISYVVGIRNGVNRRIANKFITDFYTYLARGQSYQDAYSYFNDDLLEEDVPNDWLPVIKIKSIQPKYRYVLILEGTKEEADKVIDDIIRELHEFTGDYSIECQAVEKGSAILFLEGSSEESFKSINKQIEQSQLSELAGLQIHKFFSKEKYISTLILSLNCHVQEYEFDISINCLDGIGGFLIRAKTFPIQRWLVYRLLSHHQNFLDSRRIVIYCSPTITLYSDILWQLSQHLNVPNNAESVIRGLCNLSQRESVILVIFGFDWLLPEQIYYLSRFWSALVERIRSLESLSGRLQLVLFLINDDTEKLPDSNFQFVTRYEADHPDRPVALSPLKQISLESIREWLERPEVYAYLANLIGEEWVDVLIHNDIMTWSQEPLAVLEEICRTFQLEDGVSAIESYWEL